MDTLVQPTIEETPVQEQTVEQSVEQSHVEAPQETAKSPDESWRELRSQRDRERQERERLERENYEMRSYFQQMQQQKQTTPSSDLSDDAIPEGRHVNSVRKETAELKKQLESERKERERLQLRLDYPDWDKVLTKDNLIRLAEKYPAIAKTIQHNPDEYSAGVTAYEVIKAKGIYADDTYDAEKARIQANAAKPRSSAAVAPQKADSPLGRVSEANDPYVLTPEMKRANEAWLKDKMKSRGQR